MSSTVLILPGWHNSEPDHWQSLWQHTHGYTRVEQHNWDFPLRGDWMMQLEEAVLTHPRVVLVAHSLGCVLVAAWAAHTQNAHKVKAALLVAPADVERPEMQHMLHSWSPIARARLPFQSTVAASRNDPYCSLMRASSLAQAWGSRLVYCGMSGHINTDSRLGDWPEGRALLEELLKEKNGH
nr:alpha/beta fold hydrolase [uncultured Limnohabitans sp.]